MRKQSLQLLALFAIIGFAACSKDDSNPVTPIAAVTASNVNSNAADNGGHYAFYSLEKGTAVALADSATTKWDIAFKNTSIIINGGTSGPGNGGAFVQRGATFENYKSISTDSVFTTTIPTGSGKGWYSYDMNTHLITSVAGNLIIVKTASGKYAKVEIISYYKNAPVSPSDADLSGYYNFRFAFQPNGSKTF